MLESVVDHGEPADRERDGTAPVTDHHSKSVMLRAERNDTITISQMVNRFSNGFIPEEVTVLRRTNPYYGPQLLLHASNEGEDLNYQLTAPGPDTFLYLWGAETDSEGFRESWYKLAEVKAALKDNQPQYDICSECGEPIQSLEHEKYAAFGRCPGLDV